MDDADDIERLAGSSPAILIDDTSKRSGWQTGYWAEEADITDLDLLARWGEQSGLDPQAIRDAAVSDLFKDRVEANTKAAIARGVFGVPTVDTGAKLYFGNDRLQLLDRHLSLSG